MTTAKKKSNGAGRPCLNDEPMKSRTVRMTDAQKDKLDRLGGGAWLRKKIDAAKI